MVVYGFSGDLFVILVLPKGLEGLLLVFWGFFLSKRIQNTLRGSNLVVVESRFKADKTDKDLLGWEVNINRCRHTETKQFSFAQLLARFAICFIFYAVFLSFAFQLRRECSWSFFDMFISLAVSMLTLLVTAVVGFLHVALRNLFDDEIAGSLLWHVLMTLGGRFFISYKRHAVKSTASKLGYFE